MYQDNPYAAFINNLDEAGYPYSCDEWGEMHENNPLVISNIIPYFLLDMFGSNSVPFYVFIDHTMTVHYTGYIVDPYLMPFIAQNQIEEMLAGLLIFLGDDDDDGIAEQDDNCPGLFNPDQYDWDADGIGDLCDTCIFGQVDMNNDGIINVQDIVLAVSCILSEAFCECGDMNADEILNVLDIIWTVNLIMDGG